MNRIFNFRYVLSYLLVLLIATNTVHAQGNDSVNIVKVFNAYKSAILNDKAEEALKTIDTRTKDYYRTVLAEVKKADSTRIVSLSLLDRITILEIRAYTTKEEIRKMQDVDAFLLAIRKGLIDKDGVTGQTVGQVTIEGSFAKGEIVTQGQNTSIYFHFYKESDEWKLNLTELFTLGNMSMKKMFAESGKDENVFLLELLELMTGKEITREIWEPVE